MRSPARAGQPAGPLHCGSGAQWCGDALCWHHLRAGKLHGACVEVLPEQGLCTAGAGVPDLSRNNTSAPLTLGLPPARVQVLFWELRWGPGGELQLLAGRRVQVSSTAVQLQPGWLLPESTSTSSSGRHVGSQPSLQQYVYAHASADALFSSCPGLLHDEQLPATAQVQVGPRGWAARAACRSVAAPLQELPAPACPCTARPAA